MANDLQPLVEKLETAEKLSFADFTKFLDVVREARADGRVSLIDIYRIGKALMDLFSEISNQLPGAGGTGDFGFLTAPQETPPRQT